MDASSRRVRSSQAGIHPDLERAVTRGRSSSYLRPVSTRQREAFGTLERRLGEAERPWLLDAGCGDGTFARTLAGEGTVVAIDKSETRLSRLDPWPDSLIAGRMDLVPFYRLARAAGWSFERQYLMYPNPWPKPGHLRRRWHGHPVFGDLVAISRSIELRTNWDIYAREFAAALRWVDPSGTVRCTPLAEPEGVSAFERKYAQSGHPLWVVHYSTGTSSSSSSGTSS